MITPAQRNASAALDAARPAVARLDASRSSEDLAADLIDVWGAAEAALRALVGSTVLSGQALIREARQRQLIDFDAANALAAFEAAHGRLQNVSYQPTGVDVASARTAVQQLDRELTAPPTPDTPPVVAPVAGPVAAGAPVAGVPANAPAAASESVPGGMPGWAKAAVAVAIVLIIAVGGYFALGRGGSGSALQEGVTAYRAGQREAAVSAFNRAARADPKAPLPHVYLARMAREVGNFSLASDELTLALQADPSSAIALREMAANLLAQNNYELARRFYVRAVQADPTDKIAQGYLGCTLMKLGRAPEAANFLTRAGPGPWSDCTPAAASASAATP